MSKQQTKNTYLKEVRWWECFFGHGLYFCQNMMTHPLEKLRHPHFLDPEYTKLDSYPEYIEESLGVGYQFHTFDFGLPPGILLGRVVTNVPYGEEFTEDMLHSLVLDLRSYIRELPLVDPDFNLVATAQSYENTRITFEEHDSEFTASLDSLIKSQEGE